MAFLLAPLTLPLGSAIAFRTPFPLVFLVISYPAALLTGVPAYLLLKRLGHLEIWTVVLTSGLLGALAGLGTAFLGADAQTAAAQTLPFAIFGSITGLVFWFIAFMGLRSNNRWRGP